jgi:hypothetical protein
MHQENQAFMLGRFLTVCGSGFDQAIFYNSLPSLQIAGAEVFG